jgi:Protein of unknown function (DUF1428)
MADKRNADETVVVSWVTWPSRKVRDDGWKKIAAETRACPGPRRIARHRGRNQTPPSRAACDIERLGMGVSIDLD